MFGFPDHFMMPSKMEKKGQGTNPNRLWRRRYQNQHLYKLIPIGTVHCETFLSWTDNAFDDTPAWYM